MIYICNNPLCSENGVRHEYLINNFKYSAIDHRLVSEHEECPKCGCKRTIINEAENIPIGEKNVGIGEYTGASAETKREMLKRRSHEHYEKHIKERKEYMIHEAVSNFKEASKN